uniref:Uncharacterized protein n=1 Tax=Arundo donax TaxID=35708 RepID=A0A0A9HL89_ARUDO
MLITQFVLGLKEELRSAVEIQLPDTLSKAALLAIVQEGILQRSHKHTLKHYSSRNNTATHSKSDTKHNWNSGELWKAKQLRDFRKANGLCFKCGEKYSPSHNCKVTTDATLNSISIESGDGSEILNDAMLDALESVQMGMPGEDHFLSLNAIAGTKQNWSIRLKALVRNKVLVILLDSGSSHTFINSQTVSRIQCSVQNLHLSQ